MEVTMSMTTIRMNPNSLKRFDKHNNNLSLKNPRKAIWCELGMQSKMNNNYYQLLSLPSKNVGFDEIKKAYRSMALQYHPDVSTSPLKKPELTRRFIELREAYDTLSDPNSRKIYDHELLGLDKSRKVWEKQLHGLRKRCDERLMNKIRRCEECM